MKRVYQQPFTERYGYEAYGLLKKESNPFTRDWDDEDGKGGKIGDDEGEETGGPSAKEGSLMDYDLWDD